MENNNPNTNVKWIWLAIVAIAAIVIAVVIFWPRRTERTSNNLGAFAKCLTDKGAVMYGAYWCSHCQNQKAEFGDSFKYISYIECADDPQKCAADGVNATPTWKIASTTLVGEQSLETLASTTGCELVTR